MVWKHLAHQNIVPLLGVTVDPPQIALGWMYGGDLAEYIANRPDADRLSLVRMRFTVLYTAPHTLVSYPVLLMASATFTPAM